MTRLKQLAQIAFVAAPLTGLLCATPSYAAGFTLNLFNPSGTPLTSSSPSFSQTYTETITDDFGVAATLSFMVTADAGSGVLGTTAGAVGGVVLNITNLTLTAPTNQSLTFSSPLLTVIAPYTYTFDTDYILAQAVLSGQFLSNTEGSSVDQGNFLSFVAQTNGGAISTQTTSGLPSAIPTSNFDDFNYGGVSNEAGSQNNPTLTAVLGPQFSISPLGTPVVKPFFLAAGQTLSLPSSACYVVTNEPQNINSLVTGPDRGQAAEQACQNTVPPSNPPQDVPEPSALMALLGMFGTAALFKRKQQSDLN